MNEARCMRCRLISQLLGPAIGVAIMLVVGIPENRLLGQVHDDQPRQLAGISASEAFEIKDGLELDPSAPIVSRLLYRLKKSSARTRHEFQAYSRDLDWGQLDEKIVDYRFWLLERDAKLKRIERIRLRGAPEDAEIQEVFLCHAEADSGSEPNPLGPAANEAPTVALTIIARTIPSGLPVGQTIDEPIRVQGLLYCRALADSQRTSEDGFLFPAESTVLISDALAWYPQQPSLATRAQVALARFGFDVGLLDSVKQQNGRGLTEADSEAFFTMLRAAANTGDAGGIGRLEIPKSSLVQLLKSPKDKHGELVQFSAVCRDCTMTKVPYADVQGRLGVSDYYQLSLFPDNQPTVVWTEGEKSVSYERYPVTLCCTSLPDGLTPEQMAGKKLAVDGFFYRLWKYQSEITEQAGMTGTVSPLIIAQQPVVIETSAAALNRYVLLFVLGVIGVIAILMTYLRITSRRDKTHAETLLEELPDQIDVSGLDA